jgi:hypothetical protein
MSTSTQSYGGWKAAALRNSVLRRDGIAKCERDGYEIHHLIPRSILSPEAWYNPLFCIALPKEEHKVLHKMESELRAIREERDELLKVDLYAAFIAELEVKI